VADEARERLIAALLGSGPRKGSVQEIAPPQIGQHNLLHSMLGSFGRPAYDMARADVEELGRTGEVPSRSFADLIGVMPIGPFGTVRGPRRLPPRPQQPSNNIFNDPAYYRINQDMMRTHDALPREIRDELNRVWVPIGSVEREYRRYGLEPTLRWLRSLPDGSIEWQ
jgi:hypothetical protein